MQNKFVTKLYQYIANLIGILLLILVWHIFATRLNSFLLPTPWTIFLRVFDILYNFKNSEIEITIYRIAISLGISIFLGIILGIIASFNKYLVFAIRPIISLLLGMPPIVWVILSLFWFDIGNTSVVFTIIIITMPLCFAATLQGILTIDKDLKEMMFSFNLSLKKRIKYLYIPHVINYLLPSLIIAIATGIKVSIMAEFLTSSSGIGFKIAEARTMIDTTDIFAYVVIILCIIMIVEYLILEPILKIIEPWKKIDVRSNFT